MRQPKTIISIAYYIALILIIVTAMAGYNLAYTKGIYLATDHPTSVALYTIILWYVIITFPLSFWGFSQLLKRLKDKSEEEQEKMYSRYAVIRLVVITVGLLASIAGLYMLQQKSLLWLAGIGAIGIIFCKPTNARIEADLDSLRTEETESNENNTNE